MSNYDFSLDLDSINTQSVVIGWIKPHSKVLEFGPANGRLTKYLKEEKKCDVTIVEYDNESGKQAKKYAKNSFVGPRRGDAQKKYWRKTKKFDYIIFCDVLEHLSNPCEVLAEAKRHLVDGGQILASIPNFAHNSIIIDLMNDNFEYQETGLLDKTHIHFFTYKTFREMISKLGLCVLDEVPIYSTVGANEINNTYNDVPYKIEKYLRERNVGSVYQYVFKMGIGESEKPICFDKPFAQERKRDFACQVFYTEQDEPFNDKQLNEYIIKEKESVTVNIPYGKKINKVRVQPVFAPCIVKMISAHYFNQENEQVEMEIKKTDAIYNKGQLYVFDNEHPSFYFDMKDVYVKNIILKYEVIEVYPELNQYREMLYAMDETFNC